LTEVKVKVYAQAFCTEPHLLRRLFSGKIDNPKTFIGKQASDLGKKGRLSDARVTAKEDEG
jgi:hypothetical protein